MEGRLSSRWASVLVAPGFEREAHFSFGAGCADCSWELSRLLNSMRGRQAARKQLELAETSLPLICERAGLKGCWRLRMCAKAGQRDRRDWLSTHNCPHIAGIRTGPRHA